MNNTTKSGNISILIPKNDLLNQKMHLERTTNMNEQNKKDQAPSNCHRYGGKPKISEPPKTEPDQDSSNSKYIVEDDDRERRDGPGGD